MKNDVPVKLLDCRQIAELLAVSERTVRRLVRNGALPAPVHIGRAVRWHEAGVLDYVRRLSQGPDKQREEHALSRQGASVRPNEILNTNSKCFAAGVSQKETNPSGAQL